MKEVQELESNLRPSGAASARVQALRSVGRLDPATVVKGTRVTIVGEVSGAKTDRLDDMEYRYPIMIVKHLACHGSLSLCDKASIHNTSPYPSLLFNCSSQPVMQSESAITARGFMNAD